MIRKGMIMAYIKLRSLHHDDRLRLEELLSRIPVFNREDVTLAMELISLALDQPDQKDYLFYIAVTEGDAPVGYVCFGPTPLTDGTYDLYWIAVDALFAGQGIGTALLNAVEERVKALHGRMMLIETSSAQPYELTRQFYLKHNYTVANIIPDFYRDGEDRVTFIKRF